MFSGMSTGTVKAAVIAVAVAALIGGIYWGVGSRLEESEEPLVINDFILPQLTPESGTPQPTEAARPPLALPTSIDGSLTLEPRTTSLGELVSVGAIGWAEDAPISFYLLTEEQADAGIAGMLFDDSRVLIAESMPQAGGIVRLEHHIQEEYTGEDGTLLRVAPPQKFHLLALQSGQGRTIGPLTVE